MGVMDKYIGHFLQNGIFYGLTLLIAIGLKAHYSQADSEDLRWILRPTAAMVEQMSDLQFEQEAYTGYISTEDCIIIAPACAGVNFLIIAFCMAVFSYIHDFEHLSGKCLWFCGSILGSYLLTLPVNALRIIVAISVYRVNMDSKWLTHDRLHRIEGIMIYLCFLLAFYWTLRKIAGWLSKKQKQRWLYAEFMPFGWYIAITLIVPLLRTAYRGNVPHFLEHGSFVLTGCFALGMIVYLLQICWKCRGRHR